MTIPVPQLPEGVVRLFPLPGVVVFPRTVVPFHFFEPRYRALVRDCLDAGPRELVVVLLAEGWQDDYEGRPAIHPVGGLGRFLEHRENADGTFDVLLSIDERVRLSELTGDALYRTARYEVVPDAAAPPSAHAVEALRALTVELAEMENEVRGRASHGPPPIDLSLGPADLTHALAQRYLRRDHMLRQHILETPDVATRIALVSEALAGVVAAVQPVGRRILH